MRFLRRLLSLLCIGFALACAAAWAIYFNQEAMSDTPLPFVEALGDLPVPLPFAAEDFPGGPFGGPLVAAVLGVVASIVVYPRGRAPERPKA